MLTIRKIPDGMHSALRAIATCQADSMAADVREILVPTVIPQGRLKLGSVLADMSGKAELTDGEFAVFEQIRNKVQWHPEARKPSP